MGSVSSRSEDVLSLLLVSLPSGWKDWDCAFSGGRWPPLPLVSGVAEGGGLLHTVFVSVGLLGCFPH